MIALKTGDIMGSNDAKEIIHSLFSTGYFKDIHVLHDSGKVVIKVKERPIISDIMFTGNRLIGKKNLRQILSSSKIIEGNFFNRFHLVLAEQQIKSFYYNEGRYNASLKAKIEELPNNRVNVSLILSEGSTVSVRQIRIIGNDAFNLGELNTSFHLLHQDKWWNILTNHGLQQEKLTNSFMSLGDFYHDRGYPLFKIKSTHLSLTPDDSNIYLTLNIDEGDCYTISDAVVDGNMAGYSHAIHELLKTLPGQTYNSSKISRITSSINRLLNHSGYAYPEINTTLLQDDESKTLKVSINVDAGKIYYVKRVSFKGNNISSDLVLRREILQMEGEFLNNELVKRSKTRLEQTGYFKNVEVKVEKQETLSDQVNIVYKVEEQKLHTSTFSVGYGNSGIGFSMSLAEKNWLGRGIDTSIEGSRNRYHTHVSLSVNEPYLTVNGMSMGGDIFYDSNKPIKLGSSDYTDSEYGLKSNISFPMKEDSRLSLGLGYTHSDSENHSDSADDITLNYGWILNTLDNGLVPTSGYRTDLEGKITTPASENNFYKVSVSGQYFNPINQDRTWILSARGQLGYGDGISGKEMPLYENFYAGGSGSVRGFLLHSIGPKTIYLDGKPAARGILNQHSQDLTRSDDAAGGNARATASLELITPTPILGDNYSSIIRTSLFLDIGTVWDTHFSKTILSTSNGDPDYSKPMSNICISGGLAIELLRSPIGPIMLSYAKPIKRNKESQLEGFQIRQVRNW
jgi:outer membrane protein insertion porin family